MASSDLEGKTVVPDCEQFRCALPSQALKQGDHQDNEARAAKQSVYKSLGWLDRLLALWILLAIIIGILLGNFVDGVETALQRGKFVDVSIPIGKLTIMVLLDAKTDE